MRWLRDRLRGRRSPHGTVERVLEDELGKIAVGAGRAARQLSSQRFEAVVEVRANPVQAAAAFHDAMARLGRLLDVPSTGSEPTVSGVIGGGFMNMNPAVVEVRIAPQVEGRCLATLTGMAKEGLIKQRTSEKAVRRVLGAPELASICRPEGL